jgi:hypothetical protein
MYVIILKKMINVQLSPEPTILDKLGIGIVVLLAQYFFEEKTHLFHSFKNTGVNFLFIQ